MLFSDFHEFLDTETLKKILKERKIACFQLLSPLEMTKKVEYRTLLRSSVSRGEIASFNVSKKKDDFFQYQKNFTKLNVKENYLESFAKNII